MYVHMYTAASKRNMEDQLIVNRALCFNLLNQMIDNN